MSLKKNYIYNLINVSFTLIFPIITLPYVARVLEPSGIGLYNFFNSIISYVLLVTSLGIPMYGIREIARYKADKHNRDEKTIEIFILHLFLSLLGYVLISFLIFFVEKIQAHFILFSVMSITILFNALGVNWFFIAIEKFRYITIRSLICKVISLILLFVLVKDRGDLIYYAIIIVVGTLGNNIFNIYYFFHDVSFDIKSISIKSIFSHLRPSIRIFALTAMVSIYLNFSNVYLGFLMGDEAVGIYSMGTKISFVLLSIIQAATTVLIPRLSNLVAESKKAEFDLIAEKSFNLSLMISIPITISLFFLASLFVNILCGIEYYDSILVVKFSAPLILFSGLSSVIGMQFLFSLGEERIVIKSVFWGLILNICLNIFLIPILSYNGAAIAIAITEFFVLLIQMFLGRRILPHCFDAKVFFQYIIASFFMIPFFMIIINLFDKEIVQIVLCVIGGVIIYFTALFLFRNKYLMTFFASLPLFKCK